jgi:hypothetical protein
LVNTLPWFLVNRRFRTWHKIHECYYRSRRIVGISEFSISRRTGILW